MILSVSRRTDVPAFYGEWLLNRLRAGEVLVRNPMNRRQISRVPLSPGSVDCIVFWTKNPAPMLPLLDELDSMGYRFYFQFTLTPYGPELEPGLPGKKEICSTFQTLSGRLGAKRVLWRYDPIILNQSWSVSRHLEAFSQLCHFLSGYTEACTISFVDSYRGLQKAYRSGLLREVSPEEQRSLARGFCASARPLGIGLRACCEALDLADCGIRRGSCVDRETIEWICDCPVGAGPDANQREGCGCLQSVDIGMYGTCRHDCVYCYAGGGRRLPAEGHNPVSPLLAGALSPEDRVTDRPVCSLRLEHGQTRLY